MLSRSLACSPAYLAERTPGCPPRKSTARPLSSARAGRPVMRAAWRALRMAFSTKVIAGSSASSTPNFPWAMGASPKGASSSASSLILPWLLLAITRVSVMAGLIVEQSVGKPYGKVLRMACGTGGNIECEQFPGGVLVLGNKVDRLTLLNAPEGQKFYLLNVVCQLAFKLPAHR